MDLQSDSLALFIFKLSRPFFLYSSYATTDRAWRALREMNADQNIVITGEAGSGKTEAAKLTLHYLAAVTSHAPECHTVKYQILQSNPVLEGEKERELVVAPIIPDLGRAYFCSFFLSVMDGVSENEREETFLF